MSDNLSAIRRAILVALVAIALIAAAIHLDESTVGAAIRAAAHAVGVAAMGAILVLVFAAATQFLFASIDRVLDWIHPDIAGPWFRWHTRTIFFAMAACAAAIALALDTAPVIWIEGKLIAAVTATLGESASGGGMIQAALGWIKDRLEDLLDPYFGWSYWLETRTGERLTHWAQPLAVASGLLAWYVKRHDSALRLADVITPVAHEPGRATPAQLRKRIVILCDGTSNNPRQKDGDVEAPTNVYRLHTAIPRLDWRGTPQVSIYDPGVGTDTSRQSALARRIRSIAAFLGAKRVAGQAQQFSRWRSMLELATGAGITENIEQGYREIVRLYEPGDEIWLFGFSRGAYTARCIAGVITRCGLLKAENIRFVPDAITLYRRRRDGEEIGLAPHLLHDRTKVDIKFMGLWDTVGSLGVPLWGWWFRIGAFGHFQGLNNVPARICRHVCHALSVDETRSQFMPTLAEPSTPPDPNQIIEQVWFRGGHAEVGGGYAEHEFADVALHWMVKKAVADGLVIDRGRLPKLDSSASTIAPVRTAVMRNAGWALFGTWPRWHPAERRGSSAAVSAHYGVLDDSVWRRAEAASMAVQADLARDGAARLDDRAAADGLVFLDEGQSVTVAIRADRVWDRTGVVLERGGAYEIAPDGGHWRDKEGKHCDAVGDRLAGLDLLRRAGAWARRRPTDHYCALVGHVAHPRSWPVLELGFFKLVGFFALRDPWPLRASLIGIGERMGREPGASIRIALDCPSGVFYGFANDLWTTYANNSGAVLIKITRVAAASECDATITERGEVVDGGVRSTDRDRQWTRADT